MTLSLSPTMFDDWFNRVFSLGLVLALASGLTLAKTLTMAMELRGELSSGWSMLSPTTNSASVPTELTFLDDEDFVPWPSVLPEPAAGPEQGQALPFSDEGEDQVMFDASNLTEGENLALQQLVARRQALDEREQMLDMRAEVNGRAEARLDQQIGRLSELKVKLETLLKGLDESEERKLARLVKIYETMKPKAAAEIFNRLEVPVLLHVIERMKEAKSAAVLGKMDPAIAKRVTSELAKKKELPSLASSAPGGDA
jgi:flagellar motility protein MotE (MotC chaperone)